MNQGRRKLISAVPVMMAAGAAQAAPKKSRKKQVHYPDGKPSTPVYSEVISYGDLVFISGHGVNSAQGVHEQTKAVLDRIEECLRSAGTSMENALKVNVYLRNLDDYKAMNEAYTGRFGKEPPVRTTVSVVGIPLEGCLVEIELIAGIS